MLTAAVCIALSGAGLAISLLTAWRRRFRRATKIAAWSLLPVGLYLAGLLPLAGEIGRAVGSWAADVVFSPTVWAGLAVLALSMVLFIAARIAGKRSARRAGGSREAAGPGGPRTVAPGASKAALGRGAGQSAAKSGKKHGSSQDDELSDFKEIEEILRRHGI